MLHLFQPKISHHKGTYMRNHPHATNKKNVSNEKPFFK